MNSYQANQQIPWKAIWDLVLWPVTDVMCPVNQLPPLFPTNTNYVVSIEIIL